MISRRDFLTRITQLALGGALLQHAQPIFAGSKPPTQNERPFGVVVPDFMQSLIRESDIAYLNETIPRIFEEHTDWFPALDYLPQFVVLNTLTDTLIQYGDTVLIPEVMGDEAFTLNEAQYLLTTLRFGSVATPHRSANVDNFGKAIYLKQHPRTGYRTPEHLILEELIHIQQDITLMTAIITRENHDPSLCLHAQLKGISELGAHYYIDELIGRDDYIFVMDDGTHADSAADALARMGAKVNADAEHVLQAITYDTELYLQLDEEAMTRHQQHLWQMVTTWRYARNAAGEAVDIAPAYLSY